MTQQQTDNRLLEVLGFVSGGFILEINLKLCWVDVVRLPVCSVLTSAEPMRRAPASGRNKSLAYLLRKGAD